MKLFLSLLTHRCPDNYLLMIALYIHRYVTESTCVGMNVVQADTRDGRIAVSRPVVG